MTPRKRFLIPILLILTVCSLLALLTGNDNHKRPESTSEAIRSAPDISLQGIRETYIEKGTKRWILKAASAFLSRSSNQTRVKDIDMTFYAADGRFFRVTADRGQLSLDTRDAEVSGNVIIYHPSYKIYTESLRYRAGNHIITSNEQVRIESDWLQLEGDRLRYDLNTMKAELTGKVNGIINEKITRH